MIKILSFAVLAVFTAPSLSFSKDCTPVETSPGVKSKPWGCPDLGRAATPKKVDDNHLRGDESGVVYNRDGTKVRVYGRAGVEVGARSR